jgi:hypothetical protein
MFTRTATRKKSKAESRKRKLDIEKLDSRQLMAGNVFAGLTSDGQLQITGDSNSNSVRIAQIGSTTYRVTGLLQEGAPTTVNGQGYRDFANVKSVNANLGAGNDRIDVGNSSLYGLITSLPQGVSISTGSGADMVLVDRVATIMDVNINGGTGNDNIRVDRSRIGHPQDEFRQGDLSILAGLGSDVVNVSNSSVVGDVYVETGLGLATDQVLMSRLSVGNDLTVMADEPDAFRIDTKVTLEIRDTTVADDVLVHTTKAQANVKLTNVDADEVFARMGAANDTLTLDDINARYTDVDGGAGFDVLYRRLAGGVNRRNFERDYLIF